MTNYDFLVAVIRDRPEATSLGSSIFVAGGAVMFLIAVIILCRRAFESANNKLESLEDAM